MQIIDSIEELCAWRKTVGTVALVPTMGNLHEGHLALVREAKKRAERVVVSIFVNRLQFGQGEDFDKYPRTLQQDAEKLKILDVDVVFAPNEKELYPRIEQRYNVNPPSLQEELCGKFRPGHFRGVATVVSKLFNIVQPEIACFGKKDYQQLIMIKGMVEDLNIPVTIMPVDTGREPSGLALSSRNQYLNQEEHEKAPQLYQQLLMVADAIKKGNFAYSELENQAKQILIDSGWEVDYVEVRQADSLATAHAGDKHLVIVAAARLGETRLIDNIEIHLP